MTDFHFFASEGNDGSRYCKGGFYINSMAKERAASPRKSVHSVASSGDVSGKARRKR
jgi:hypothetical protein